MSNMYFLHIYKCNTIKKVTRKAIGYFFILKGDAFNEKSFVFKQIQSFYIKLTWRLVSLQSYWRDIHGVLKSKYIPTATGGGCCSIAIIRTSVLLLLYYFIVFITVY